MSTTVKQRFVHMTARKLRFVADAVRGKSTDRALSMLTVMPKTAAKPIHHAIKSAVHAAKQSHLDGDLFISSISVDEGPAMKRRLLRSRGRATRMEHRMSHITVTVKPITAQKKPVAKHGLEESHGT